MSRLRKLEEINVETGLKYCIDDEELYLEALRMYVGGDKRDVLGKCLAESNFENYRVHVHALKSTSLNVGAESLSAEAKKLEFACRDENFELVREKHSELMERYGKLLERLAEIIS